MKKNIEYSVMPIVVALFFLAMPAADGFATFTGGDDLFLNEYDVGKMRSSSINPGMLSAVEAAVISGGLLRGGAGVRVGAESVDALGGSELDKGDGQDNARDEVVFDRFKEVSPRQANVWRSMGAVSFVLGGLLMVNALLKKRLACGLKSDKGHRIKVIERVPFDSRRSFVLLEADGKRVLVGVGADQMATLADLGADEDIGDWKPDRMGSFSDMSVANSRKHCALRVVGSDPDDG